MLTLKQFLAAEAAVADAKRTLVEIEKRLGVPHVEMPDLRTPVFKPAPLPADRTPRRVRAAK